MIVCDRDTCGSSDCLDSGSIGKLGIPSSEDFMINLLHLKCKVIELARRQMQKEFPEPQAYVRMQQNSVSTIGTQIPVEHSFPSAASSNAVQNLERREFQRREEIEYPNDSLRIEALSSASESIDDSRHISQPLIENQTILTLRWLKKTLSSIFPIYWIIIAIGILGFTILIFGVLLGAFMCTNGSHSFPFFLWSKSRGGRAVY